jgi:hypothetical protein
MVWEVEVSIVELGLGGETNADALVLWSRGVMRSLAMFGACESSPARLKYRLGSRGGRGEASP